MRKPRRMAAQVRGEADRAAEDGQQPGLQRKPELEVVARLMLGAAQKCAELIRRTHASRNGPRRTSLRLPPELVNDMTNDHEPLRLTVAELWVRELLAIVEAAAAGLDVRSVATQLLARIDALETPERPVSPSATRS